MEKEKLIDIIDDVSNKTNTDLTKAANDLFIEFNKTKDLIISLTRHLETVEKMYIKVNDEIEKRTI